ncbi:MAG: site-specific DNA-methyltransferase, partial [Planctomycetes bacterium]|nr:site-specific DNA-methyltransferase [Planctomycetota bacterium]
MPSSREKLQQLLRELFQFGSADLDFGIYRIMNFKRDAIERFIKEDLIEAVDKELSSGMLASQSQAALELKEVAAQICETLGETALNGDDSLEEAYHGTPLGKHYLELQARASQAQERPAFEATIFNHLYNFFSRYYDNGDFLSKRRYSRREKYAVPYNGEEVYLHWANNDQYYVKTGEYFNDYRFKSPYGIGVHFMLVAADIEKDNAKGDKRFFVPLSHEVTFDEEKKEITIPFQYRPLTEQEEIKYGQRNQQDAITKESLIAIPAKLEKDVATLPALLSTHHTTADGQQVNYLEYHLRRYTRRNTSDFFVHKDLKGFLTRELDFYLKNEVLNLDEMEAAGEPRSEAWFQIMHVIRSIGSRVIEFLAQIEDFQKRLFEKRKFILETQYCITMANVPDDFYAEIAECEAQWQEWKELFHLDEEQPNLFTSAAKTQKERRIAALKEHPTLVLDTKHFNQQFKDRLLATYDNLDEVTDGLLIHSENFQALNLLLEKYRDEIKCIYIDPPFNTGGSNFLYKNEYRHSSWMSMIANVAGLGAKFLTSDGIHVTAIDDYELSELSFVLRKVFGEQGQLGTLVVENKPSGRTNDMFLATCHEYYLYHMQNPEKVSINFFPLSVEEKAKYKNIDDVSAYKWRDFLRTGGYSTPQERPNSYYPIYLNENTGELSLDKSDQAIEILPIDSYGRKRVWRKTRPSFLDHLDKGEMRATQTQPGKFKIEIIDRIKTGTRPKSIWTGARYDASSHGTKLLNAILGESRQFDFPKSVDAVRDALYCITSDNEDFVLDFFAGSGTTGHAIINLNREDGGNRKFILVEMGEYFDTVLLPRIKKVTFTP